LVHTRGNSFLATDKSGEESVGKMAFSSTASSGRLARKASNSLVFQAMSFSGGDPLIYSSVVSHSGYLQNGIP
jgi:hypothetical protein